jgi:hypothetical protein
MLPEPFTLWCAPGDVTLAVAECKSHRLLLDAIKTLKEGMYGSRHAAKALWCWPDRSRQHPHPFGSGDSCRSRAGTPGNAEVQVAGADAWRSLDLRRTGPSFLEHVHAPELVGRKSTLHHRPLSVVSPSHVCCLDHVRMSGYRPLSQLLDSFDMGGVRAPRVALACDARGKSHGRAFSRRIPCIC